MFGLAGRTRRTTLIAFLALLTVSLGACADVVGIGSRELEILNPRDNETLYGFETLRARVRGLHLEDYDIYWYIDDGVERRMFDEWDARTEHKYYEVDTWDWYWNGRGPYIVGFIAEDRSGRHIAERTVRVYVE